MGEGLPVSVAAWKAIHQQKFFNFGSAGRVEKQIVILITGLRATFCLTSEVSFRKDDYFDLCSLRRFWKRMSKRLQGYLRNEVGTMIPSAKKAEQARVLLERYPGLALRFLFLTLRGKVREQL